MREAWVVDVGVGDGGWRGGRRRRTMRSFMWGVEEVAMARRVGSVGERAIEEGEKAIQALEWGARFWRPRRWRGGGWEDGLEG